MGNFHASTRHYHPMQVTFQQLGAFHRFRVLANDKHTIALLHAWPEDKELNMEYAIVFHI